jgi:hypothetical protein
MHEAVRTLKRRYISARLHGAICQNVHTGIIADKYETKPSKCRKIYNDFGYHKIWMLV